MRTNLYFFHFLVLGSWLCIVEAADFKFIFAYPKSSDVEREALKLAVEKFGYLYINDDLVLKIKVNSKSHVPQDVLDDLCVNLGKTLKEKKVPIILDATKDGVPSESIKSFAANMGIPTISTSFGQKGNIKAWLTISKSQENFLLQVSPPNDIFTEIVPSIVSHQNLSNYAVLYDSMYEMEQKIARLTETLPVRSILKKIDANDEKGQIREIAALNFTNLFVMAPAQVASIVISAGSDVKYLQPPSSPNAKNWFVGYLDANESSYKEIGCECEGGIILIQPDPQEELSTELVEYFSKLSSTTLDESDKFLFKFYYDLYSKSIKAVTDLATEASWPKSSSFLGCDEFDKTKIPTHPNFDLRAALKKELSTLNNKWIIEENGNSFMEFNTTLRNVKFSPRKDKAEAANAGTWVAGLDYPSITPLTNSFNLNKDKKPFYRVVTNEQAPFVLRENGKLVGICIDILDKLAEALGFDYKIEKVNDGSMGYIDDDGEWSGIVKELMLRKADIGMASISVMAERERVIDFTIPYNDLVGISILMKKTQPATSLFKFLTVLEMDVWLCILAAYFITSFLLWIFDRYSPYSYQNNMEKYKDDEEKRVFSLKESLWFCMTSLTPQGGGEAPKNLSGRLVAATWWLFGFIIMASYTANLAAFLTVSRLDTPIESLDDLAKQYKVTYAPVANTAEMRYFQRMADIENKFYEIWKDMSLNDSLSPYERSKLAVWDYPVSDKFTKMWQAMIETGFPSTVEEALAKVRASKSASEGFALLGDATDNLYYYKTTCELQIVGEEFSRKPYAIALQEGSPLKAPFNVVLQDMINNGTLAAIKEKWWKKIETRNTCEELNEEEEGISIKNIGGVFIVIFLGIGGALVALTLEYFWHQYQRGHIKPVAPNVQEGWTNSNFSNDGFRRHTEEGFSNRYLDPLNLYGDHITRRNNIQRAFNW